MIVYPYAHQVLMRYLLSPVVRPFRRSLGVSAPLFWQWDSARGICFRRRISEAKPAPSITISHEGGWCFSASLFFTSLIFLETLQERKAKPCVHQRTIG